jgi:hypothetical protein
VRRVVEYIREGRQRRTMWPRRKKKRMEKRRGELMKRKDENEMKWRGEGENVRCRVE